MNLFTYGSLMYQPVWQRVVRGQYQSVAAILPGYKRRLVRGEEYPALVEGIQDERVQGVIYLGLSDQDVERLDQFEGDCYCRQQAAALLEDGSTVETQFYLFRDEYKCLLTRDEWDQRKFEEEGIHDFLAQYLGFSRV